MRKVNAIRITVLLWVISILATLPYVYHMKMRKYPSISESHRACTSPILCAERCLYRCVRRILHRKVAERPLEADLHAVRAGHPVRHSVHDNDDLLPGGEWHSTPSKTQSFSFVLGVLISSTTGEISPHLHRSASEPPLRGCSHCR